MKKFLLNLSFMTLLLSVGYSQCDEYLFNCDCSESNWEDGLDDDAFIAGAQSGEANLDELLNIVDLVIFVNTILNGE